jgi:ATP-dependent DNA helicase RecQ
MPRQRWQQTRAVVLNRDNHKCVACGVECGRGEADVHHLMPRNLGGSDELANLVTLCDGCHAVHHPNLQLSLARRFVERWALRVAKWLDTEGELPDGTPNLGGALRLLGLQKFRGHQLEVVLAALKGQSVLLVSPTGSGKTLCFQLPTLLRQGTSYVISPLKALMAEQVVDLTRKKIPCSFINSDLSPDEKKLRYELLTRHALKFFYCTPERFDDTMVRPDEVQLVSAGKPSFLVIDEAHCIDRWGRDFRPNYSRLGATRSKLGNPPVLAFTATAGIQTQERILQSLNIPDARVIVTGVDRPNIALLRLLVPEVMRFKIVASLLCMMPQGRAMIFVPTRKVGERVQHGLKSIGLDIPFYHSKLGAPNDRDMLLGRFTGRIEPALPVIICTNAFGMGLDVPDVRLVVHWQHPATVEDYLQEFGRAGRDGKQSLAVLFSDEKNEDLKLLRFMADMTVNEAGLEGETRTTLLKAKYSQIDAIHELATKRVFCLRAGIIQYFEKQQVKHRKSLGLRIVEWLFVSRTTPIETKHCCDKCNGVSKDNYTEWIRTVFQTAPTASRPRG